MTRHVLAIVALVTGILMPALFAAGQQQPPLVIDSITGKDLFQFYCVPCHGRDGRGAGPVAASLKKPPADLTTIADRRGGRFPRAEVTGFVTEGPLLIPAHGTVDMPVWGPIFRALDPSETRARVRIENLVSYLESIQTTSDAGSALFTTYCATCHGVDARGGGPVADMLKARPPSLTQFAVRNNGVFPVERVFRIIEGQDPSVRSHGSMEMPVWGDAFRKREGLSDEAVRGRIEAIVRYLGMIQDRRAH